MGHTGAAIVGIVIMVVLIVGLDAAFLRHRFALRLIVNIGIVVVFAIVYFTVFGSSRIEAAPGHSNVLAVVAIAAAIAVIVIAVLNLSMRRQGYAIPGRAAVRCESGHLFRTLWIEGGSFTAMRLGPTTRYLHCPVGDHWSLVHPVKEADLTDAERAQLAAPASRI